MEILFIKIKRFWCNSYLMFFVVGVSFRILYYFVSYLYVSRNAASTSVGEKRANLSANVYL